MKGADVDIGELTKNFRVCFDKAGLTMYVVPREDAASLINGTPHPFNNEDVQLYGTRVLLHLPCDGAVYGRYLMWSGDYVSGVYVVIPNAGCDVDVSWSDEGISTRMHVRSGEALLVIVRLMRLRSRRVKPDSDATRVMRVLGLSGKLLYADANHEVQVFGVTRGVAPRFQGTCMDEFSNGLWRFVFSGCGYVIEVLNEGGVTVLLIGGVNSIVINRRFPSLDRWYELGRVWGFENYLIVLKS